MHDVPSTNERNQETSMHRKACWDKLVLLARGVPMGTECFRETQLMISIKCLGGFLRQSLSLHSTGQPGTHCVNQAGLKHWGPPASPSQALALQVCATTLSISFKGEEMLLFGELKNSLLQ